MGMRGMRLNNAGAVKTGVWLLGIAVAVVGIALLLATHMLIGTPSETPLINGSDTGGHRIAPLPEQPQKKASPPPEVADASKQPKPPLPVSKEPDAGGDSDTTAPRELEGIHVFPPLGTKPNLSGIIVPDDFELPPGYVRHYQSTDDGRQLVPILMYDPQQPPLDWRGDPIPVTPDRVVPPDMAPKGMPIQMLELPKAEKQEPLSLQRLLNP
jgi:hypothetical protein